MMNAGYDAHGYGKRILERHAIVVIALSDACA